MPITPIIDYNYKQFPNGIDARALKTVYFPNIRVPITNNNMDSGIQKLRLTEGNKCLLSNDTNGSALFQTACAYITKQLEQLAFIVRIYASYNVFFMHAQGNLWYPELFFSQMFYTTPANLYGNYIKTPAYLGITYNDECIDISHHGMDIALNEVDFKLWGYQSHYDIYEKIENTRFGLNYYSGIAPANSYCTGKLILTGIRKEFYNPR